MSRPKLLLIGKIIFLVTTTLLSASHTDLLGSLKLLIT